jgi:hypothetical protein
MARPYSVDPRERVVRAVEGGASRRATAAKFDVSVSFVIKLMHRSRRRATVLLDRIDGGNGPRSRRAGAGFGGSRTRLTIAEWTNGSLGRSSAGRFLVAA